MLTFKNPRGYYPGDFLFHLGFLFLPLACHPFLFDNYVPAKWIALYFLSCIFGFWLIFNSNKTKLPSSKSFLAWVAIALTLYLISFFANWPRRDEQQLLDIIVASIICITFYQKKTLGFNSTWIMAGVIPVILYGYLQWFGWNPFPTLIQTSLPASFFGFQNMTAEYIGICSFILFYSIFHSNHGHIYKFLLAGTFLTCMHYLFLLQSRAAFLGLLVSIVFFVFSLIKSKKSVAKSVSILIILTSVIALSLLNSNELKRANLENRLIRWKNSTEMIFDHPFFGVGPGQFEITYYKYHSQHRRDFESSEERIVKSPHNGYLELMAENGLLLAVWIILGLIFFLKINYQKQKKNTLPMGVILFIATDALFAFPLEGAFSFFVFWACVGLILKGMNLKERQPKNIRFILVLLTSTILSGTLPYSTAQFLMASAQTDYEDASLGCRIFPANWQICLQSAELSSGFKDAEMILQKILKRQPDNIFAIKSYTLKLFDENRLDEACSFLKQYRDYFKEENPMQKQLKICKKYQN